MALTISKLEASIQEVRRQSGYIGQRCCQMRVAQAVAAIEADLLDTTPGGPRLSDEERQMVFDLLSMDWGYRRVADALGLDSNTILQLQQLLHADPSLATPHNAAAIRANRDARRGPRKTGDDA